VSLRAVWAPLLLASLLSGCATSRADLHPWLDPKHAKEYAEQHPHPEVMKEADILITGLSHGQVQPILDWMSPKMRKKYGKAKLERIAGTITKHFGRPLGVVEERVHHERNLRWYSGLIVYGLEGEQTRKKDPLRLMLYQFAVNPDGQLTRLLVREHVFRTELRRPADNYETVNRFSFPSSETWTIAHGGRLAETNKHHNSSKQRYAYDVVVKRRGSWGKGQKTRNSDYYCYGLPLYAPAPGRVIFARDGVAENRPQKPGKGGGNGVVIDHGFGEYSQLWHMIPGTVKVKEGDWVQWGQELGSVGNSGQSTAPHIHFHVESAPHRKGGIGLPAEFTDVMVNGKYKARSMPIRDQTVRRSTETRTAAAPTVYIEF
jgi:murein DD-endopeptidase MepM/ murein hydrolase activator NlpD